jgi:hypothetical protein
MGTMETSTTTQYPRHSATGDRPSKILVTSCDRCGGSGIFHVFGTCFRCGGNGVDPTQRDWAYPIDWTDAQCEEWNAQREARNEAQRERAQERRQAKREATWAANVELCPGLLVVDEDYRTNENASWFGLLDDMRFTAHQFPLSDKQVAAFNRSFDKELEIRADRAAKAAEREEAKANTPHWEAGRVEIEGAVATRSLRDTQWGSTWKLRIVLDDGRGLWVTEPNSIITGVGDRVRMTVTVEPADDDPTFAFGKRPTKAEVTQEAPDGEA